MCSLFVSFLKLNLEFWGCVRGRIILLWSCIMNVNALCEIATSVFWHGSIYMWNKTYVDNSADLLAAALSVQDRCSSAAECWCFELPMAPVLLLCLLLFQVPFVKRSWKNVKQFWLEKAFGDDPTQPLHTAGLTERWWCSGPCPVKFNFSKGGDATASPGTLPVETTWPLL